VADEKKSAAPEGEVKETLTFADLKGVIPPPGISDEELSAVADEDDLRGLEGAVRGTPSVSGGGAHPPFQLPSDEDDPSGSLPAMHTFEQERDPVTEDLREKIKAGTLKSMEEWEEQRVEKSKKYLDDARALAPDIAKTVNSFVNSLVTEGFSREEAIAFAQTILDKKLQPFL